MPDQVERERRRRLLKAHLDAENAHDLTAIMGTFAQNAEMTFNSIAYRDPESIARAHAMFGWAGDGALENARVFVDSETFTEEEIVIEGRVVGKHVRPLVGFPPTHNEVTLHYATVYRFDTSDKLVSERIVMNLGPIGESK